MDGSRADIHDIPVLVPDFTQLRYLKGAGLAPTVEIPYVTSWSITATPDASTTHLLSVLNAFKDYYQSQLYSVLMVLGAALFSLARHRFTDDNNLDFSPIMIVHGGPGGGKTTLLSNVLKMIGSEPNKAKITGEVMSLLLLLLLLAVLLAVLLDICANQLT